MHQNDENSLRIEFLYKALEDTQNTIRFIDTKASLILVGLTIICTFMGDYCSQLCVLMTLPLNYVTFITITSAIITIISFILTAFIIFKSINPMSSPATHVNLGHASITIPFYLFQIAPKMGWKDILFELDASKLDYSVESLSESYSRASEADIIGTLTYELLKVSYIREKKNFRVNKAISIFKIGLIFWLLSLILFRCIA